MTHHLYVIGNGFDLHHKYRSALADYGKWLMDNHPDIYYSFEEWFDIPVYDEDDTDQCKEWKNWWSYFEQRLGELSMRNYIEDASFRAFNEVIQVEERRAYDTYVGERIADTELTNLIAQIKGTFREWIQSLLPGEKWFRLPIERESSLFLTFNYTPTLETIYKIQRDNILYIHGSIDSEEYILGHGLSYQDIVDSCESGEECPDNLPIEEMKEWYSSHSDDFITEQAKKIAIERMFDLRKDVEQIIEDNQSFFEKLNKIKTIHIYGFSFSPIDLPYLYAIIAKVDLHAVQWEINLFTETDKTNIEHFMESASIPKVNVHLIRLTDIQLDPQLKIFA